MPFVKLDSQILESSLWFDKPARDVFITALLMAVPRALEEPEPAIEVSTLEETGFVVPRGEYGFVAASGTALVQRSGVPIQEGLDALRRLCLPEGDSRSREFDGRRMARINYGYVILNFRRFRDKDHTAAARQARYRLRKAEKTSRNVTLRRNVTQDRGQRTEDKKKREDAPAGANGHTAVALFCEAFKGVYGANPSGPAIARASKDMKDLLAEHGPDVYAAAIRAYIDSRDPFVKKRRHDPKYFTLNFDQFSLTP